MDLVDSFLRAFGSVSAHTTTPYLVLLSPTHVAAQQGLVYPIELLKNKSTNVTYLR